MSKLSDIINRIIHFKGCRLVNFCTQALIVLFVLSLGSCDEPDETENVSHVSYLPRFEIVGGEFNSFVVTESAVYQDPGARAYENKKEIKLYAYGDVDLTQVGVYSVLYYAENSDGLYAIGERIVAVTYKDVADNDLSGKYTGTLWSPLVEMKVEKVDQKGLYTCSDVMGYLGAEMKGKFVDLGNNELALVHGEGDFGAYASFKGTYTLSSLSWTISLLDDPYADIDIPVTWVRTKDK